MAPEEKEELVAVLAGLGGGIVVGVAGTTIAVIVLGRFGIYGPPNAGTGVLIGFFLGVVVGTRLFRWRLPPGR